MVFIPHQPNSSSLKNTPTSGELETLGELNNQESYFQILLIEANPDSKKIKQKLVTSKKQDFKDWKLEKSSENPEKIAIADCLPSQGVEFPKDLQTSLCKNPVYIANFYPTARCLLQARKISQVTARTWWAYRIYFDFLEQQNSGSIRFCSLVNFGHHSTYNLKLIIRGSANNL